jgi:hypothetical protein
MITFYATVPEVIKTGLAVVAISTLYEMPSGFLLNTEAQRRGGGERTRMLKAAIHFAAFSVPLC